MSLGKVIDTGNAINAMQLLGQLMEEYDQYIEKSAIENSAIVRHIMPSNIQSVVRLSEK
jgi:predicted XRE-type DNA-binding protein